DPAGEDVVATRPRHDGRERGKDQAQQHAGRADDEGGPRPVQEGPDDDDRDAGEDRDGPRSTERAADECGGVEEQGGGDADLADRARGLRRDQHLAATWGHATSLPPAESVAAATQGTRDTARTRLEPPLYCGDHGLRPGFRYRRGAIRD